MTISFVGYYSLLAIEIVVCTCANTTLYVAYGTTARMTCPLVNDTITWTGPPDRKLIAAGEMAYTDDYLVIRNRTQFTLEVKLFTERNEGTYVCETSKTNYDFLVHMINPPKLQITPGPTVIEGTQVQLKCIYNLQNEIKTVAWKYEDTNKEKWSNLKQVELGSITRSQAGEYSCTVGNQHLTASANATMVVLYQPEVSITYNDENRELKCTAVGVPNHYDFNYWKHKTEFGVFLRDLPSSQNGSLSIPYIKNETDRHCDRGIYVCNVSNNVSVNGNKYVLAEYWLNSTGKPYFVTTNKAKQYGILKQETNVSVDIVSFTKDVDAALFTDEMFLSSYIKIVQMRVIDTVYAKDVFVQGIRLTFTIHIQSDDDFRSYTVVVNNTQGPANYTINLSSASRPEPPFSLHCLPRENEIAVSWKPGFNGGYKQHFFVEYRSRQEHSWKILNASDYQSNTTTVVTNLAPGTKYFIRIFSKNKINSSDHTEQCLVETADGIGGVENDMYEMQNNIQQQQQPQDDNPDVPVYSSIDRRHQLSIGSTVSYSVTKKKKPNPVGPRKGQKGDDLKKTNHCEMSTSNENGTQDLNYIEVCFDQKPKDYPFKIHGLEQKTDYIDVDFTQKVYQPPDSDKDDISDDGFASAEVKKNKKP
ncbi:unnamed protein product [Mytilus coruscus]|uniref:NCAM n=1 Tax=Mytilus coruscus TaxID=42192 RepID=A0A6J8ELE1_MYTCO|nr:unnamed protein product [Mytilus coruscus]